MAPSADDDEAGLASTSRPPPARLGAISRNVLLLGLTSFWADVASDMVVPLLPAFLVSLGAGATLLGFIEGAAEATASLFKYLSGRWADRVRRLLPLAAAGYALAAAVRPLLALAFAPWHVLAVRLLDRVGKGVRTSPRDKLLAASAAPERLAEAFSFHRGMDHLGAALGPLLAAGLLLWAPGRLRLVFAIAAIPGALAVLVLLAVREERAGAPGSDSPANSTSPSNSNSISTSTATSPSNSTVNSTATSTATTTAVPRDLLLAIALFTLGNSTDALLLLRAQSAGVATAFLPLLWTLLHAVRAGLSWPLGRLADKAGRRLALASGWALYALCYTGFALATRPVQIRLLFAAYGVTAGLTEGSERALVAASVPAEQRGRALGLYNLVSGAGLWAASIGAGLLWEWVSPAAALGAGALLAALASLVLALATRRTATRSVSRAGRR